MRRLLALFALTCALSAQAAGPYVTDDAAIAAPGTCQLEAWSRWYRWHGHELTALPACNTVDRIEATLGFFRQADRAGVASRNLLLQGKVIFREFAADTFGIGAVAGAVWRDDPAPGQRSFSQGYAYVPVTVLVEPASTQLHLNLGVMHSEDLRRRFGNWAVGAETALTERWALNLEFYGEHDSNPSAQAGVTIYLLPDRLALFALAGAKHRDDGNRWATLGFSLSGSLFRP